MLLIVILIVEVFSFTLKAYTHMSY